MKTFKSGLFSLLVLTFFLFSIPAQAGNIEEAPGTDLRNQLVQMVQNPNLQENGLSEAELYLHFKVNDNGEILLLAVNTSSEYMAQFAKEKLHRQKIDLTDFSPNSVYKIRIKFELQ